MICQIPLSKAVRGWPKQIPRHLLSFDVIRSLPNPTQPQQMAMQITSRSPEEDAGESPEDAALLGIRAEQVDQGTVVAVTRPLSKFVLYFMAIHFLLAFSEVILVAPLIRLYENSLCLKYYNFPRSGVQEEMCKIPDIQKPLATIRGWKSMFDTIPGSSSDQRARHFILTRFLSTSGRHTYGEVRRSSWTEKDHGSCFARRGWCYE